jgi:hypothetical protein
MTVKGTVNMFGAWWGLDMFSMLSQIANQHFGTKAHNLGELAVGFMYT